MELIINLKERLGFGDKITLSRNEFDKLGQVYENYEYGKILVFCEKCNHVQTIDVDQCQRENNGVYKKEKDYE
jgi:hypothetical protein